MKQIRTRPFTALAGSVSAVCLMASVAVADQVFLDDVIVDGSLCAGLDCVNGESFGFDTIRIKENNLRIHFQDTSASASFPTTDWRLVANDSSNGGASYLGIEDADTGRIGFRVEGGAPANALYVEADGDIGVKTNNPIVDIHVVEGNTPTLRLEQDGSDGFTPQTYDIAANEANFFIRDVTNGSALFFRAKPGAPEDSIFIAADGDLGLNTDSPSAAVHLRRTDGTGQFLVEDTGSAFNTQLQLIKNGTPRIRFDNSNADAAPAGGGNDLPAEWDIGLDSSQNFIYRSIQENANLFKLTHAGDLIISGEITTAGSCSGGCDRVFEDDYEMLSIQEHAASMWSNGYLPNVGPTAENGPFNLSTKVGGILNELEHAHVYIAQQQEQIDELTRLVKSLTE